MKTENRTKNSGRAGTWLVILAIVFTLVLSFFVPWNVSGFISDPHPVQSYEEAVERIEELSSQTGPAMNPDCMPRFMTHGEKVERAVIFVHGYTNCPQQFTELGGVFFDLGYNVLIAPLPQHGFADRMTEEQAELKAEELTAYADEMVDIAQGLGEQVVMVGISGGGVTTAWAAQTRPDLDLAVVISPAFGYHQIPTFLTAPVMNIYLALPNSFEWWDPVKQANIEPEHAYPRYATHALVQFLRLGFAVRTVARRAPPAAGAVLVITNASDTTVNNEIIYEVTDAWRAQGAHLTTFEFGVDMHLEHDLIDPAQANQQIGVVYPKLVELIAH
jgi:alpha-beta hydrolase superfamily lysophospholipase